MRNTIGGKSYKKNKSGNVRRRSKNPDKPVDTSSGVDFYAIVQKRLGDNRLLVKLANGTEVQAVIPGKFKKKVWFNSGDYIQVQEVGIGFYDIIQKIINQTEQQNAQLAFGKHEAGENDIFRPDVIEEDSDEEANLEDEIDEFGNVIKKVKPTEIQPTNPNISASKLARKQREKQRDIDRRTDRDFDVNDKPNSLVETVNTSDSETSESSQITKSEKSNKLAESTESTGSETESTGSETESTGSETESSEEE
jgi:initiation factor 1A